jgi:hypothetical protein
MSVCSLAQVFSAFFLIFLLGILALEFVFDLLEALFLIPYIASSFTECTLVGSFHL